MAHALAAFIQQRMDEKGWRQRDIVSASGLSRALVSKYVADDREQLTRLPDRKTLEGLAKALGVPIDLLIGKAVEALGLGYTAGDFVNDVTTASNRELLDEIESRLSQGGEADGHAAPTSADDVPPFLQVADRYADQAEGDLATAIALLEHDGVTGARVSESTLVAALVALRVRAEREGVPPRPDSRGSVPIRRLPAMGRVRPNLSAFDDEDDEEAAAARNEDAEKRKLSDDA